MIVVMLITAVETTGDVFATGEIVEKRIGSDDIARALRADGLATTIGGVFNSFPYTCFAENVGLVRLTRVKSRYVVATAGVIMILHRADPQGRRDRRGHPAPGARRRGAGDVRHRGRRRHPDPGPGRLPRPPQRRHRRHQRRPGDVVTAQPDVAKAVPDWAEIIFGSGITLGSITAIVLNLLFHHVGKDFGPGRGRQPGRRPVRLDQVNAMRREEFVRHLRRLFQGPRWVVERAYDLRPFERHPRPAARLPGGAVRRHREEQRRS